MEKNVLRKVVHILKREYLSLKSGSEKEKVFKRNARLLIWYVVKFEFNSIIQKDYDLEF